MEIPLDEKVTEAIARHHISQAYGAVAHVRRGWEKIKNPRSIFLLQLPKQKAEQLGIRERVHRACDTLGFTIERLQKMLPKQNQF